MASIAPDAPSEEEVVQLGMSDGGVDSSAPDVDVDPAPPPVTSLPGFLPWEEDPEMFSKYLDRKEELETSHQEFLRANPEVKAILADFLQTLFIQKPDDVYQFAHSFFAPFSPQPLTGTNPPTSQETES